MTRRMYDAVEWQRIPANAQMVAGYVDGAFAWPHRAWARFPNARHVRISVIPLGDHVHAGVLDVETVAASVATRRLSSAPGTRLAIAPSSMCSARWWTTSGMRAAAWRSACGSPTGPASRTGWLTCATSSRSSGTAA